VWEQIEVDPVTGTAGAREVELPSPDGGRVPISISIRSAFAEHEQPVGTLAILTDRTLERRFEEAKLHAERSEAVSEMAAAIAHEIRNPLAAMRGSVQEIGKMLEGLGAEMPAEGKGLIEITLSESDRIDAIISDFLAFARMRPVKKTRCEVCRVVRETALMLTQTAEERGVHGCAVDAECDESLVCRFDPLQVRQVLLNLGLNSIDAVAGVDAPRIELRARPCALLDFPCGASTPRETARRTSAGEQRGVEILVEDNGAGMNERTAGRALNPFFTTKERGTGLGLAVAARIVKAHEGLIRVDSTEGRGTTVAMWLPTEGE
jgi:two-component system sensor histidine kinase PilS (NtrC family)